MLLYQRFFLLLIFEVVISGYYLDKEHNGKGYMTEVARLAVKFAFDELKLHRIEAGVMPHNIRSMRLGKGGF
jgi:ribosomal-protein-alanine N-acetyltransferase